MPMIIPDATALSDLVIMDRSGVCSIRNDTKLLAEIAANSQKPGYALDLGTGTGYVGLYLAQRGWQVDAIDISPRAIELAQANAQRNGLPVRIFYSDLFDQVTNQYDLIAFNPPMWPHETEWSRLITNSIRTSMVISDLLMNSVGKFFESYRKNYLHQVLDQSFTRLTPHGHIILAISQKEIQDLSMRPDVSLINATAIEGMSRQKVAEFQKALPIVNGS